MTEKLYEKDSMLRECEATVLECLEAKGGYEIVLDRTVIFPEGGGQMSDTGTISGAKVTHAREKDGRILNLCERAFAPGEKVKVELNWTDRLDHMQQHCGEHILSYAFWKLFGANNVGFRMAERAVSIDLDKEVTMEEAAKAEDMTNAQIWEDRPVTVSYVPHTALADLTMRKKNTKLTGTLRLVSVEDSDICTCCGTHPPRTGMIGLVKITRLERHKGGTRVEFLCGRWALEDARAKMLYIQEAGNMLSTKEERVCESIRRMEDEIRELKEKAHLLIQARQEEEAKELLAAASVNKSGDKVLAAVEDDYDAKSAKSLLARLTANPGAIGAVIYSAGDRINYLFGRSDDAKSDLKAAVAKANEVFGGKGGGGGNFAQGSAPYAKGWHKKAREVVDFLNS